MSKRLIDYGSSSSDSDDDAQVGSPAKRGRFNEFKLPSATTLLGKKKSQGEYFDDPTKHDGRIRSFKHEPGNWATYVYISITSESLRTVQERCQKAVPSVFKLLPLTDLHISLSKTVSMPYHLILPFQQALREKIRTVQTFPISLRTLCAYTNDEKTRTFLAFRLSEIPSGIIRNLISKVDTVMEEFNMPKFYEKPQLHVSFLWCLGDELDLMQSHFHDFAAAMESVDIDSIELQVQKVLCKAGNKYFRIPLK